MNPDFRLFASQLENKILRESLLVSFHLFIKTARFHTLNLGKISINDYFLTPKGKD
jgi:hypothetical protein